MGRRSSVMRFRLVRTFHANNVSRSLTCFAAEATQDNGIAVRRVSNYGAVAINMNESSAGQRIIHTDEDGYEMMYWSIKFGVSIERLVEAISKVGPLVINVERYVRASSAVMASLSATNPHCYAAADGRFVQPDPTVFLV